MRRTMHQKHAFSLVELAIVLVILGLLAGGVLSGTSLIRAAELRSVVAQHQRYATAQSSFNEKYFAMPGDMSNATKFWNMASGATTDAECKALTTASTDKATCNGDGDGTIDYDNATNSPYESSRAWQHLANAGLVEGTYIGVDPTTYKPGISYPAAKISNGVWGMWYLPGRDVWPWAPKDPGHYIALGGISGPSPGRWHNAIIKPDEAYNIDKKIDDGMPYLGKVNDIRSVPAGTAYTPNCAITDTDEASAYNLTSTSVACNLIISAF